MPPVIIRHDLDPTGVSPDNLVLGEVHAMVRRTVRCVAPIYGAFFTESMVVKDVATNLTLVQGTQYFCAELYQVPTGKYGKEVCAIIVITDEEVSDNITMQYQSVGGEYGIAADAIIQMLDNLELDERPVTWPNIIHKPTEFPPSHHLHDVGDVYGFEYVVHAMERIKDALLMGDNVAHDKFYKYVDDQLLANEAESTEAIARALNNAGIGQDEVFFLAQ